MVNRYSPQVAMKEQLTALKQENERLREALNSGLPFEKMDKVYDAPRGFLLGHNMGIRNFPAMVDHLKSYGAKLPPYLNPPPHEGHITKSEQAQILWEMMVAEFTKQALAESDD